ncbi:MAG: hypothetical protein QXF25_00915 [Candidatus Pacearchaeota archaeon]
MEDYEKNITRSLIGKLIGGSTGLIATVGAGVGIEKLLQNNLTNLTQDARIIITLMTSTMLSFPLTLSFSRIGEYLGYRGIRDISSDIYIYLTKLIKKLVNRREEY